MKDSLIHLTQRKNGQRSKIAVIAAEKFEDAFKFVKDSKLSLIEKAFLTVSMSGGLRFTECYNIRPCDLRLDQAMVMIRVLKKKRRMRSGSTRKELKINPVYRRISLHPEALTLLNELFSAGRKPHFAKVFSEINRSTLDRHIRELFGSKACHHSISRHSHITYRLHALKESPQVVAEQMQVTLAVATGYNHIDQRELVKATWKKAS